MVLDYEPESSIGVELLAAHLFYRALLTVPSLIRKWLSDCTDKQLSSSVIAYTSQNFSPVIIRTELMQIKSPEAMADLADENLTIKVALAVNEVTATYIVDEHPLEITLKMPGDWPLHNIELRDLKKVGVLEDRWRAWVLGVQQVIWSQVCLSLFACSRILIFIQRMAIFWMALVCSRRTCHCTFKVRWSVLYVIRKWTYCRIMELRLTRTEHVESLV